jgi:hypothetical protein
VKCCVLLFRHVIPLRFVRPSLEVNMITIRPILIEVILFQRC